MRASATALLALGLLAPGCKTASPVVSADAFPREFASDAAPGWCTRTTVVGDTTAITRRVQGSAGFERVADDDGDGAPDRLLVETRDTNGSLVALDTWTPDRKTKLAQERRSWDGSKLVRREVDRFDSSGLPGTDGEPDEVETLVWESDRLIRVEVDQVGADGLLGTDGVADLVTTWAWEDGVRKTGTTKHVADDLIVEVRSLSWRDNFPVRMKIDLAGDGSEDVDVSYEWSGGALTRTTTSGALGAARVSYQACK